MAARPGIFGITTMRKTAPLANLCSLLLAGAAVAAGGEFIWKDGKWAPAPPPAEGTAAGELALVRRHLQHREHSQAVKAAERLLKRYSADPAREEAMLLAGQAELEAENFWQAYEWFEKQLDEFPGGMFLERALLREMDVAEAFLAGRKRVVAKVIRLPAKDEALKILQRVAEHVPGTELAERALLRIASYKYSQGEYTEAAEAYDNYLQLFPRSERSGQAMLQAARAMYAAFKGSPFDETPLIEAEQRLKAFAERYPAAADKEHTAELLSQVVSARAQKAFRTAEFYDRTGRHKAARFYYKQVAEQYARTPWGRRARQRAGVPPPPTADEAAAGPPRPPTTAPAETPPVEVDKPPPTTAPAPIPLEKLAPAAKKGDRKP